MGTPRRGLSGRIRVPLKVSLALVAAPPRTSETTEPLNIPSARCEPFPVSKAVGS
jgi:hypothetical protein